MSGRYHSLSEGHDENEEESHPRALRTFVIIAILIGLAAYADHRQNDQIIPNRTAVAAVATNAHPYIIVTAHFGDSAWRLITNANSHPIKMDKAIDRFKVWNGTTSVNLGSQYKVPVYQ